MEQSVLDDVHPDHNFWVVDGTTLKNIYELLSALEGMDESTFKHHVNEEKNDFHNWIRDVHQDQKLAKILSGVIEKEAAVTAIKRRIEEIQKPARDNVSGGSGNLRGFSEPEKNEKRDDIVKDDNKSIKGDRSIKNIFNSLKDKFYSWKANKVISSFQSYSNFYLTKKSEPELSSVSRVPFPKPVPRHNINHKRYEVIVTVIAVTFIISLIAISSQAAEITGAVIGSTQVEEVQFLGVGGVFAVVVLLFAVLHALERHAKDEVLE